MSDAVHSFSDLISDFLTLIALRLASLPPDHDHPYGHGRFEPLGCLVRLAGAASSPVRHPCALVRARGDAVLAWQVIGIFLVLTSASFTSSAMEALVAPPDEPPGNVAFAAAIISVLSKEALFRATDRVGRRLNSQVVIANAWHHRSDALSSVVAIFGIGGASLGWRVLDPLCGVAVAVLVGWMGLQILLSALAQLSDTTDEEAIALIERTARGLPGVRGVHGVRCRWMSSAELVADLSLCIAPGTSVARAHELCERVRVELQRTPSLPHLGEVMIRPYPASSAM